MADETPQITALAAEVGVLRAQNQKLTTALLEAREGIGAIRAGVEAMPSERRERALGMAVWWKGQAKPPSKGVLELADMFLRWMEAGDG